MFVRLGWKSLPGTNSLAYYGNSKNMDKKSYITLGPGTSVVKLVTTVIYICLEQARVFVPGKPFQPSLMFASRLRHYSQTLD